MVMPKHALFLVSLENPTRLAQRLGPQIVSLLANGFTVEVKAGDQKDPERLRPNVGGAIWVDEAVNFTPEQLERVLRK